MSHLTAARFVDWALRHARALWFMAILLAIPATARTVWMYAHLQSEMEQLLPRNSPSVLAFDEFRRRSGDHHYLGVVVDAKTPSNLRAAEKFLDDLAARIRTFPKDLVASVRTGDDEERTFVQKHAPLYLELDDLRLIRTRIEARRDYEVGRLSDQLIDDDAPPPPIDFDDIRAKYQRKLGIEAPHRGVRFTNEEEHLSVLLVEVGDQPNSNNPGGRLFDRVHAEVAALGGVEHYGPGMRIGYAGDATIAVEELRALVVDLSLSSVVVLLAVLAAILAYYRWWRSVLVVVPPLLLSTVYSFAIASLPPFNVSELNSNTAFLGSIILGNGINFGLMLLARYVEERRQGLDVRGSIELAVAGSRAGTLAAAACAGVSYAALALTQFRGFRQFGFIGGFGMILSWGLAFLLMPSLIARLDRDDSTRPRPKPERTTLFFWLAKGMARAPLVLTLLSVLATSVAVSQVIRFRPDDLESDFSKLRRRDTWESGEGYWGDRMNTVLGRYLTPFVFLADNREQASEISRRMQAAMNTPPFAGRIASVRTIDDMVPADQATKVALLNEIRKAITPRMRQELTPEQRSALDPFFETLPAPFGIEDLPRTFVLGLRERDGTAGRLVLVYPSVSGGAWWNADEMRVFVTALRELARRSVPEGVREPRLAGSVALSSDIVQAIAHDGPMVSLAALVGVIAIAALLLRRPRAIAYITGAMIVGVVWLAGASRLLGIRINFANFIAFPITFGIGIDYAVNVMSRYKQDGSKDILASLRSTGAAVALCSLTTIIGYSSLLMAKNRALFLFGVLAVLGEGTSLTVALVSLPAVILLATSRGRIPSLPAADFAPSGQPSGQPKNSQG